MVVIVNDEVLLHKVVVLMVVLLLFGCNSVFVNLLTPWVVVDGALGVLTILVLMAKALWECLQTEAVVV